MPQSHAVQLTHWREDEKAQLETGHKEGGQRNAYQVPEVLQLKDFGQTAAAACCLCQSQLGCDFVAKPALATAGVC